MVTATKMVGESTGIRFTKEDRAIISALKKKFGLKTSAIVKMAIRKLHEIELQKAS